MSRADNSHSISRDAEQASAPSNCSALPDKPTVLLLIRHPSGIGVHGHFTAEKAQRIAKYLLDDLVKLEASRR